MRSVLLLSGFASMTAAICSHGTHLSPRAGVVPVATFNYDALTGPLNWLALDEANNQLCSLGQTQSPINVVTASMPSVPGSSLNFKVDSHHDGADIENLGSTLEVFVNGSIIRDDKSYSLKQFHFHTPSEHRIDDEYYPMELHFVFQAEDNSLSVVGFPMEISTRGSDWLTQVFANVDDVAVPGTAGRTGRLDFTNVMHHLSGATVYQYSGSLTTPPCKEGIAWNLVDTPISIDLNTFNKVKRIVKFNARYTQDYPATINLLDNARHVLDSMPQ